MMYDDVEKAKTLRLFKLRKRSTAANLMESSDDNQRAGMTIHNTEIRMRTVFVHKNSKC